MTHPAMPAARFDDAALVAECLNGNRDAFRRIVEQYQTLISSIAYCATGDVTVSEDLAQETFVSAWKQLPQLREPAKLRSWLCSIVRFLISKEFRRRHGEPVHAAEPLAAVAEWPSPEPLPADHVMTQEEKAILWRSLERIPEIYREPLVLYYRENQSVEAVAQNMDLTEDAVKQRLSRGRKLLQEQVLAFVEAALKHTKPDKAFACGVLAALPLATTTVKAATAGVAIKGGSSIKAASSLAMLSAILTAGALYFISLFAFLIFSGACVGWMMSRACRRSAANLRDVTRHWRLLAIAFLGIVTPSLLLNKFIPVPTWSHTYDAIVTWYLFLAYFLFGGALIAWLFRWWRSLKGPVTDGETSNNSRLKQRLGLWLGLGLLLPGLMCCFLIYCAIAESTITARHISTTEAETMIAGHKDADVLLTAYASGLKYLKITLPESRRQMVYFLVADQPVLDALDKSGIHYVTRIEGRDFSDEGLTWKGMLLLAIFVTSMGGVLVAAGPWKRHEFQQREAEARRDERTAKAAFKAFSVCVAVVLLALAFFVGVIARWRTPSVSLAEIKTMASELKTSQIRLFQYSDGVQEFAIMLPGRGNLLAVADAPTIAYFAEQGLTYRTLVQGRDFGFALSLHKALPCGILLIGAAFFILLKTWPKIILVLAALLMIAVACGLFLITDWHGKSISAPAGRLMLKSSPGARVELYEFNGGDKELMILPHGRRNQLHFMAPADEATLALLSESKIPYKTFIQGRDFGLRGLSRGPTAVYLFLLAGGTGLCGWLIFWRRPQTVD